MFPLCQNRLSFPRLRSAGLAGMTAALLIAAASSPAMAQARTPGGSYAPVDERTPPGLMGSWAVTLGRSSPHCFQPVRIEPPSTGVVTVYHRGPEREASLAAPSQIGMMVGHTYRLRVSRMPEYPGIDIYPSVELIDRLHPPAGREQEFPIPVQLTREEIELALEGRLVTKVIYLERPQSAVPRHLETPLDTDEIYTPLNLFAEAGQRGRPMAIVRLGGRLPDSHGNDEAFFGSGGPVVVPAAQTKKLKD